MSKLWAYRTGGIEDSLFVRGKVPMTKSEVRAVTLGKLALTKGDNVLDIGAGTGAVSIEMALQGCQVVAIERNKEGVKLIQANKEAFNIKNLKIIQGLAPENLPRKAQYDRVFIGGSGGNIEDIFVYIQEHLKSKGRVVANTITLESTHKILNLLETYGYEAIQIVQINVSRSKSVGAYHMMLAENPVTILSATQPKKDVSR